MGVVATGITADTPVGTRLVAWLVWLGLTTSVVSLVTLLVLDGPMWLDTKVRFPRPSRCGGVKYERAMIICLCVGDIGSAGSSYHK